MSGRISRQEAARQHHADHPPSCAQVVRNSAVNETYVLYQCGLSPPSNAAVPAGAKVFSIPLTSVAVGDTTPLGYMVRCLPWPGQRLAGPAWGCSLAGASRCVPQPRRSGPCHSGERFCWPAPLDLGLLTAQARGPFMSRCDHLLVSGCVRLHGDDASETRPTHPPWAPRHASCAGADPRQAPRRTCWA